jgi:hypothetical protein
MRIVPDEEVRESPGGVVPVNAIRPYPIRRRSFLRATRLPGTNALEETGAFRSVDSAQAK